MFGINSSKKIQISDLNEKDPQELAEFKYAQDLIELANGNLDEASLLREMAKRIVYGKRRRTV